MEIMAWDGPKWALRGPFAANPDLAEIWGRTDLDFETLLFFFADFLSSKFLDVQVPDFQNLAPGWAWARPGIYSVLPLSLGGTTGIPSCSAPLLAK